MNGLDCLLLWHVGFKGNVDSGKRTKDEELCSLKVRSCLKGSQGLKTRNSVLKRIRTPNVPNVGRSDADRTEGICRHFTGTRTVHSQAERNIIDNNVAGECDRTAAAVILLEDLPLSQQSQP